jgi:agmatinase
MFRFLDDSSRPAAALGGLALARDRPWRVVGAGHNGGDVEMTRTTMFGPPVTFLGVPEADLDVAGSLLGAGAVVLGAPFDGGTSHRSGCRFGPSAIRSADYLPHDGRRPHLALGVDPLVELAVVDAGDVEMPPGDIEASLGRLESAVGVVMAAGALPVVLGGDHSIALADATAVARALGWGAVSMLHFDAHADTGDSQFGSLYGHGTPMRRLIESGAIRADRFVQIGLRGYWPEPETLAWMAAGGMRSYEMTEVCARGLEACLTESFSIATDGCTGVFLSVDVDVVDPGSAPGTGTPEPGGLTSRQLLDAVRRAAMELPVVGLEVVEVSPPYDHADVTAYLASRIVLEALSGLAWQRRVRAGVPSRRPEDPLLDR